MWKRLRALGPRHLLGAWVAYWLVLAGVVAAKVIPPIQRATGGPDGSGNLEFGFSNTQLNLTVKQAGNVLLASSASVLEVAMWIAGPPLLLWLLWITSRKRVEPTDAKQAGLLGEPGPELSATPKSAVNESRYPEKY